MSNRVICDHAEGCTRLPGCEHIEDHERNHYTDCDAVWCIAGPVPIWVRCVPKEGK